MPRGDPALLRLEVPRRDPDGLGGGEQGPEPDQEAGLPARHHGPLAVPEGCPPFSLQRAPQRN